MVFKVNRGKMDFFLTKKKKRQEDWLLLVRVRSVATTRSVMVFDNLPSHQNRPCMAKPP